MDELLIKCLLLFMSCLTCVLMTAALRIADVEGSVSVTRSDFSENTAEVDGGMLLYR